jgi:hypothetical protein
MHLVSEVLDEQLTDARDQRAGRVDGIVIELREGRPPRLAYIEVSPITLFSRFSRGFARWYARLDARLGHGRGVPFRIPWSRVQIEQPFLRIDLDARATPIYALENWLRRTIIERIPWS